MPLSSGTIVGSDLVRPPLTGNPNGHPNDQPLNGSTVATAQVEIRLQLGSSRTFQ